MIQNSSHEYKTDIITIEKNWRKLGWHDNNKTWVYVLTILQLWIHITPKHVPPCFSVFIWESEKLYAKTLSPLTGFWTYSYDPL